MELHFYCCKFDELKFFGYLTKIELSIKHSTELSEFYKNIKASLPFECSIHFFQRSLGYTIYNGLAKLSSLD